MRLFDDIVRTDFGRIGIRETEYDFLNRSAKPEAEEARRRIEELLSRYPEAGMPHLSSRLRSDNQNFHGALFELVLNRLFLALGCEIDICDLDPSQTRPDFMVKHAGKKCYVEAIVVDPEKGLTGFSHYEEDAFEKLESLSGQGSSASIHTEGILTRFLRKSAITKPFQNIIGKFDPSDGPELDPTHGIDVKPVVDGKWRLTGRLYAIDSNRFVQIATNVKDDSRPEKSIEGRLADKAKKYGHVDVPLVVALNAREFGFDIQNGALDALFGKATLTLTYDERITPPKIGQRTVRKPGGLWQAKSGNPRYTRLMAVVLFKRLGPFKLAAPTMVYFNPFVDTDGMPDVFRRLSHAVYHDDSVEFVEGETLKELLFH